MTEYLGIDTSNYTTSAALTDGKSCRHSRKLLLVAEGERGIRQSEALFHHIKQLPDLLEGLLPGADVAAIGVSTRPRNADGSYMPCFLAGHSVSRSLAAIKGIPLYETSHQVGHILAALYSCKRLDLLSSEKPFIAFHVSGGTTDCLLVKPDSEAVIDCKEISSSLDLKAGQAVDRVGVALGLAFPCGAELERLALKSERKFRIRPTLKDGCCCLSGLENICKKMIADGEPSCDTALYCIKYIEAAVTAMAEYALGIYGELPVICAGGVMSDGIIRESMKRKFGAEFAEPALSTDNACGTALFAAIKEGALK